MLQAVTPRPLVRSCQSPLPRSAYSRARPRVENLPFGRRKNRRFPETIIRERSVGGTSQERDSSAPRRAGVPSQVAQD